MTAIQINDKILSFSKEYNLFKENPIQQAQLQHRFSLVEAFNLPKGSNVLEIGCGQGDTTMAIAHAIGAKGKVVAIDNASRDYGAPFTLGQATDHILQSTLGERITFHLETDFESFDTSTSFDVAVLSHSSWYFKEPKRLLLMLKKLKTMTNRICFAEWDLSFTELSQRPHFCAVSILALYSQFIDNDSNVQNLFDKQQIQQLLVLAGFEIEKRTVVDASYLPDAKWEKEYANIIRKEFIEAVSTMKPILDSYYNLMNVGVEEERSLNSFVLIARSLT